MNKLHPIYYLAFFVVVAIIMIYKVTATQQQIAILHQNNIANEALGKELLLMKERWKDAQKAQARLEGVLGNRSFKANVTKKDKKRNVYAVTLENLDGRTLDIFTSKLLNEYVTVKKISIERFSDSNASVSLECVL